MIPAAFVLLDALPLTASGKIDRRSLPAPASDTAPTSGAPQTATERAIAAVWQEVLLVERVGRDQSFFDLGGHSLRLVQVQQKLRETLQREIAVVDLFRYPTIGALAAYLHGDQPSGSAARRPAYERAARRRALLGQVETADAASVAARLTADTQVAIVGMSGRFPGAADIETFWQNLCAGVESIQFFSDQELLDAGVAPETLALPNYVKAGGALEGSEYFDAGFFGYSPREAEVMDPQQRMFLECAWAALEHAGYAPDALRMPVGVYAGVSLNHYWFNLASQPEIVESLGAFHTIMANDRDFLTTRVSYKLGLRGPSVNVQSACSTSLVAVHLACQSLLCGECDMALAGGVSVAVPAKAGYLYHPGGIASPDGHCRAFDVAAEGCINGSGLGIVVLRRLADALADGDTIYAVVRGSALNNDGALKVGYTAPSITGQAEVIAEALAVAGVDPATVGYVETHGTGTTLGDPIEVAALAEAFGPPTEAGQRCAIGSVKTNIGHLDAAAGVSGLIKAALATYHGLIPPSLHFRQPNPRIDFADSPFFVNTALSPWPNEQHPRRAGVSSFGIGGTNAHIVLEQPPEHERELHPRPWQLLVLSAKTAGALDAAAVNLAAYLRHSPRVPLADIGHTLRVGRSALAYRRALVCQSHEQAVAALEALAPQQVLESQIEGGARPVVFLFPGGGVQYVRMGQELYDHEPVFRGWVDRCAALLAPRLGRDLRLALFPTAEQHDVAAQQLRATTLGLPALFVVEYALAQLWMGWGLRPQALLGHSLGEYVAACLAGVFTLEDALALVAMRGRLLEQVAGGAMLSVPLPEQVLRPRLGAALDLAAVNGPALCVVAGPPDAVAALERELLAEQVACRRVPLDVAAHSALVEPILDQVAAFVYTMRLAPPQIPMISGVSGGWLSGAEASSPDYWVRHLRATVRFAEGLATLGAEPERILLEVGPRHTLSSLARRQLAGEQPLTALASLPHQHDQLPEHAFLLTTLGRLWLMGAPVDWPAFAAPEQPRRVALPTYPFERQRYWVERKPDSASRSRLAPVPRKPNIADWFYLPSWKRTALPTFVSEDLAEQRLCWLVLLDGLGLGAALAGRLEQAGQTVVTVAAGAAFARLDQRTYALAPRRRGDYSTLLVELTALGLTPSRVVHLWGLTSEPPSFDDSQDSGFYSLVFLAQTLEQLHHTAPIEITAVVTGTQAVFETDRLRPAQATLLGPANVIAQEYPALACRAIDVDLPSSAASGAQLVEQLLVELTDGPGDKLVAYRGSQRWAQLFEPLPLKRPRPERARLRPDGIYLITGGLGQVGLAIAGHLARTLRARLVLVGRTALPERSAWEDWLTTHDQYDPISVRLQAIYDLEAAGATVLALSADVSDRAQMQTVLDQTLARFGALHGVIHAAGVTGEQAFRAISALSADDAERQFQPKARGLMVLAELLEDQPLDFCLLCSSLGAHLGGLGFAAYAAANLYMDIFAQQRSQAGAPWISVNWEGWRFAASEQRTALGAAVLGLAVTPQEGAAVFQHILALGPLAQVCVSTGDLQARVDQWLQPAPTLASEIQPAAETTARYPRRNIQTAYVAPGSDTERRVAQICESLLGVTPVGIHDSFFELGGHSLLAIQLASRLRAEFAVEVSLHTLFTGPTIAEIAAIIDMRSRAAPADDTVTQMLALVEQLSDEEAAALLAQDQEQP